MAEHMRDIIERLNECCTVELETAHSMDMNSMDTVNYRYATTCREAINEIKRLRAALTQLVIDYQDVPDPSDSDGQSVFEDARAALGLSRRRRRDGD